MIWPALFTPVTLLPDLASSTCSTYQLRYIRGIYLSLCYHLHTHPHSHTYPLIHLPVTPNSLLIHLLKDVPHFFTFRVRCVLGLGCICSASMLILVLLHTRIWLVWCILCVLQKKAWLHFCHPHILSTDTLFSKLTACRSNVGTSFVTMALVSSVNSLDGPHGGLLEYLSES